MALQSAVRGRAPDSVRRQACSVVQVHSLLDSPDSRRLGGASPDPVRRQAGADVIVQMNLTVPHQGAESRGGSLRLLVSFPSGPGRLKVFKGPVSLFQQRGGVPPIRQIEVGPVRKILPVSAPAKTQRFAHSAHPAEKTIVIVGVAGNIFKKVKSDPPLMLAGIAAAGSVGDNGSGAGSPLGV